WSRNGSRRGKRVESKGSQGARPGRSGRRTSVNTGVDRKIQHWAALNTEEGRALIARVADDWKKLIDKRGVTERDVLAFLADRAGLFSYSYSSLSFPVAELRLGAEYRPDFMLPVDDFSAGVTYHLIELESPSTPPYRRDGKPGERLTAAIQQIEDWRAWIDAH